MASPIYDNLRNLINLVDELRDVGLHQIINLPRVCVVGTQSSGKSSVLEAIVGMDFLPRGEGIVTRRPLELRLIHTAGDAGAYAVFENDKTQKWTDFSNVNAEIERLTDDVAGKNKAIVDCPIVLSIFSAQCPDLTLIDLPGITRVPLRGSDQTDDIEKLTRDMALRYVEDPRTIVLAVIPANADMSTSDALQLARRVDPKGLRTIGVVTKIDLMDHGTDAVRMLLGEEVPLRLGYTGVINRSQADIISGKSVAESREAERHFFADNPVYRLLPSSTLGVQSLVEKLTKVLFRHIKHLLPDIKQEIDVKRRNVNIRLEELGELLPASLSGRAHILWVMINDYCEIIRCVIRGRYVHKLQTLFEQGELSNGSQIRQIFNDLLYDLYDKSCTAEMTDVDIDLAIRIHEGDALPGFPSPDTFEYLIRPHMKKLYSPSFDCLDETSRALENLCQKVASRVFYRFPLLSEKVLGITQTILIREKDKTKEIIENLVEAETGYLFTNDSSYLDHHGSMIRTEAEIEMDASTSSAEAKPKDKATKALESLTLKSTQVVASAMQLYNKEPKTRYSVQFITEIRRRIDNYFALVVRSLRDVIPKSIGHFLVHRLLESLQYELYTELSDDGNIESLLGEPPAIVEERHGLNEKARILMSAHQLLMRDPVLSSVHTEIVDAEFDEDLKRFHHYKNTGGYGLQTAESKEISNTAPVSTPSYSTMVNGFSKKATPTGVNIPVSNQKASVSVFFTGRAANASSKSYDKEPPKRQANINNPLFLNDN